jgi:hypothetical protein
MSDEQLIAALVELGRDLDQRVRVDVTSAVIERVRIGGGSSSSRPGRRRSRSRTILLAAALLMLLAGTAVAVKFAIRGVQVTFSPSKPPATASPAALGERLFLGDPTSLARARQVVAFEIVLPRLADLPDPEVYTSLAPAGGSVSLVYPATEEIPAAHETGVGLILTEFRGSWDRQFIKKVVYQGAGVAPVEIGGRRGIWIAGSPHEIVFLDENGRPFADTLRLAANTLLWPNHGLTVRLESALSKQAATRIARQIR